MNPIRAALAAAFCCAMAAATASSQVHQVAFESSATDVGGTGPADTSLAASPQRVVVVTNLKFQIRDRQGVRRRRPGAGVMARAATPTPGAAPALPRR